MLVLGIAGTAKNTGKTTATAAIINNWQQPAPLAITSIGYDGESKDTVTGLPKPRLAVPAGALVVTAQSCIEAGSASLEILERTDISTPLGRLVVGRVRQAGLAVLAGPNNESALRRFIEKLGKLRASLLLVDGALGRLAPMSAADGLILATGAARSRDLAQLAQETAAYAQLFSFPPVRDQAEPALVLGSLLVERQGGEYAAQAARAKSVEFSGVVDVKPMQTFIQGLTHAPDLIFRDPVRLLLAQESSRVAALLRTYVNRGGRVMVRNPLPLKAITVNPFYPEYNAANSQYVPGYMDADELYAAIAGAVSAPVVDVVRQGGAELVRLLEK